VFYSREKKLLFLHVPKTGGLSIINTLRKTLGIRLEASEKKLNTPLGHESQSLVDFKATKIEPNSFFSFAFVRNPYSRAVSMYNHIRARRFKNRCWYASLTFNAFCCDLEAVFDQYSELKYAQGRTMEYISSLNSGRWPNTLSDTKCLGQYWWMSMPMSEVLDGTLDFIGRFESLQADFDVVCKELGLNCTKLRHDNRSRLLRIKPYSAYYSSRDRRIIEKVYEKDFELFDYSLQA
jgi:hypothetical protein